MGSHSMNLSSKYTLRQATPADLDSLRRLHHAAMRDAVEPIWGWDEKVQDRFFDERFQPEKVQVVLVDGVQAGCFSVEERADEVFLAEIRIDPAFQNKGIGSQIVKAVISDSARKGLPVMLTVLKTNRAKVLYERHGFVQVGEFEERYRMRTKRP